MSKPKLNITIIGLNYAPEPSGNAPYTTSLAEGLAGVGHSVHVITGYPHYPAWTLLSGYTGWKRNEEINGVSITRLRHHIPTKPSALARLHMELSFGVRLMLARWHNPDVVLVVSPALISSAFAVLRARLRRRRPGVGIWVQDLYSRGVVETSTGGGATAKLATAVESRILMSSDGVTAIHDRFKEVIATGLGVPAAKIKVIRNWTHLPASPTEGLSEMRRQLGWLPEDIVVLHAGNMGKKQGLENVVEAARLAGSKGSPVRFVLMGNGNQRRRLESLGEELHRLSFVDSLPGNEFQLALAAADVLLVNELPGVREMAVPSKLTSYFNAGVPVIAATDAGSVTASEIATSGAGIRVDAANPEALLAAAELLGLDSERSAELGSMGLRFREDILSEGTAVADYDEFITSLASSRGR